ncbi:leucine-rich repeat domain, L domain-like protein [Artemisia annua]|uniref:Leucine-rich repeat domain, L domain-like protein n=1 Tax=Artemisia annua TaxID=35608 RepID=A0A2U1PUD4_ARTAN|nr:leucine-rich repeat domain, L domain-like protein [Artemisia annua]
MDKELVLFVLRLILQSYVSKEPGCLSMLTYLYLDDNPIVSMPNCVRSLPRLKALSLMDCETLVSIEHPPRTLKELICATYKKSVYLIQKITFDPEMSPQISLVMPLSVLAHSSIEIEGVIKIQPIAGVDDAILCSLGWRNLEFIKKRRVGTCITNLEYSAQFMGGKVMPKWIRRRSKGKSISFTIPSTPKKLRGLNVCYVCTSILSKDQDRYPRHQLIALPYIKISNITKNLTWIYKIILKRSMECGVSLVYENDDGMNEKEEDALCYYKSWNHIIGGDLSPFHLTTGEYCLYNRDFYWSFLELGPSSNPFIAPGALYKVFDEMPLSLLLSFFVQLQVPNTLLGGFYGFSSNNFPSIVKTPKQAISIGHNLFCELALSPLRLQIGLSRMTFSTSLI